ncbi:MAG: UbiD family decarboxylase [Chromatiales bacterium]|nr:UbiD family decarboxylase [Chromatiales bacterium]
MPRKPSSPDNAGLDRRQLISAAAGLAGLGLTTGASASTGGRRRSRGEEPVPAWPYDSFRDYMRMLEARGLVMRIPRLDQDAYESTALMYRLVDQFGMYDAPAILIEEIKQDGVWLKGPLIANHQGHWDTEALTFGIEPVSGILPDRGRETYRKAVAHFTSILDANGGQLPEIAPVEVSREEAPCKEVVLRGDEINLYDFAFIKSNPADSARYINTGSTWSTDPEMGTNFGTYRCEIKGPRKIAINPEPGQTADRHFKAQRERGEKYAYVSLVLGQDPITWLISGSLVGANTDEISTAGGLRGKAVKVVKSETNDMRIPALSEMVIEGRVPLQEPMLPEGPFGEMYGYMGLKKDENYWMEVDVVTHRRNPWFLNSFTGVTRGFCTAPLEAVSFYRLKRAIPHAVAFHSPVEATGLTFLSIRKTGPGQGLAAGRILAQAVPIAKVVVVVDDDIDVLNRTQMMHTLGSRWQPYPASEIIEEARGMPLDPSLRIRPMTSKIVIDATRQLPEEGGPDVYPDLNRALLERYAPDSFARVDDRWGEFLKLWTPV